MLKTIAWKAGKQPSTQNGVEVEQDFWKARGIDPHSLNVVDGSGLSPGDRVTTLTMATVLQSAKAATWFPDFYESLPVANDMKMKNGLILNVLTYAGYQTYKGRELCFSIMVNNFNGSSREIKEKMFRVLDEMNGSPDSHLYRCLCPHRQLFPASPTISFYIKFFARIFFYRNRYLCRNNLTFQSISKNISFLKKYYLKRGIYHGNNPNIKQANII